MTPLNSRTLLAALFIAAASAACDAAGTPGGPVIPPPVDVRPGTWFMHTANGTNLPAQISDRFIGVSPERTFLDSARILINSNGQYQQLYWIRVLISGNVDRTEVVLDEGIWTTFGGSNSFRSFLRNRAINVVFPTAARLESTEQMLYWSGAPLVSGVYLLTRP